MSRHRWTAPLFVACWVMSLTAACAVQGPRPSTVPRPATARLVEAYGRLPLHFEQNRGQAPASARFIARTGGGGVLLGTEGLLLSVEGHPVRLAFAGGLAEPAITALDPLPGRVNYYVGKDPAKWRTGIPTFARVRYAEVYPGIDVVVYGNQRQLEYDFVVAPGADPGVIEVRVDGADAVELRPSGDMLIRRGEHTIVQRAPVAYQMRAGHRELVAARYVKRSEESVVFSLGAYDRSRPLIIDPVVVYSARIGVGTARAIAVDSAGYAYFTGENAAAFGDEYPMVNAAYPQRSGGLDEIFVTKLSPDGSSLVYSTYIGQLFRDAVHGIATDGAGNAYITGMTKGGYPTTAGAFQETTVGTGEDASLAFVTKFGPSGAVVYSTYLQGTTFDNMADPIRGNVCYQGAGNGIAADAAGHAYVVGYTSTNDFPTTPGAYIPSKPTVHSRCHIEGSGYLTKLAPDGSSLVYSTYLDGDGVGLSVTVDGGGNAYVGGIAAVPPGTLTATLAADGATTGNYVAKFNSAGFPTQTTVIGTSPASIDVGPDGSVYVVDSGPFAGRLNASGTAWLWTTSIPADLNAIAVAGDGSAWIAGFSGSADFPMKDALRPKTAGTDAVVLKLSATGALLFSSPLGDGAAYGIALDGTGGVYLTGFARQDFTATTPGAFSRPASGGNDVFVLKLSDTAAPPAPTDAPPTVTITNPSNNVWTGNSINVAASATGDVGLVNIELWGNGGVFATFPCNGTTCSGNVWWVTGPLPPGAYEVNAVATDTAGNQTISAKITIFKDATSPVKPSGATTSGGGGTPPPPLTAAITSPAGGATVNGTVPLSMSASNAQGSSTFVLKLDKGTTIFSQTVAGSTATGSWNTEGVPNGIHTLDLTVTDGAGRTASHSIAVTVGPPLAAAITSPANGATVSGDVTVTMTATNAAGSRTFNLKLDNGITIAHVTTPASTATITWSTAGVPNGVHTLNLTLTDGGGRTATAAISVTLNNTTGGGGGGGDTTKPTVSITSPSNNVWTGNSINVAASASDNVGLANIKLWGNGGVFATLPCSGTTCSGNVWWVTGPLPPGAYEVNAVATDTAGNQTVSAKVTIFKDATSPVKPSGATTSDGGGTPPAALGAAITTPGNGAAVSGATVGVTMTASNAQGSPTSFVLKVDNGTTIMNQSVVTSTVTTTWDTTGLSNGPHTLNLTVTDGAGRTATAAVSVTVNNTTGGGGGGDTTAPSVAITKPSNGAWTGNSIDVTASATDNVGLASLKFFGNGTQFAQVTCSGTSCGSTQWWLTGSLPSGKHTITVVATDTAGNQTTSAPVVINK